MAVYREGLGRTLLVAFAVVVLLNIGVWFLVDEGKGEWWLPYAFVGGLSGLAGLCMFLVYAFVATRYVRTDDAALEVVEKANFFSKPVVRRIAWSDIHVVRVREREMRANVQGRPIHVDYTTLYVNGIEALREHRFMPDFRRLVAELERRGKPVSDTTGTEHKGSAGKKVPGTGSRRRK